MPVLRFTQTLPLAFAAAMSAADGTPPAVLAPGALEDAGPLVVAAWLLGGLSFAEPRITPGPASKQTRRTLPVSLRGTFFIGAYFSPPGVAPDPVRRTLRVKPALADGVRYAINGQHICRHAVV